MAAETRSVAAEIAGRVYHLKTKDSDAYIQNLVKIVNDQMKEIMEVTNTIDSLRVADMTALNLADLFFKTKNRLEQRLESLERERDHLQQMIERALEEHPLPDT